MKFQKLLEEVKQYVISYFDVHHEPELIYHDIKHTKDVVAAATRIANHYQLNDEDFFVVIAAAWFHDTGYFTDKSDHETKSVELANHLLNQLKVEMSVIDKVKACIMATKLPQSPTGLLAEIVCDADLFHLGTDQFGERNKFMRREIEAIKHIEIDRQVWRQKNIELLESHHYFTDYAQLLLNEQKQKNLEKLKSKNGEANDNTVIAQQPAELETDHEKQDHEKKQKTERPERGIETMFRITSGNNQRLSDMADNKAHILITVNSIILSAIISLVLRKLEENNFLTMPTFLLLTVSLLSMTFAILATRPSIPNGKFTHDDIAKKQVNLLFFGNFYKMQLEDYNKGMLEVMNDKEFLYGMLIRDVYAQGVVLGRKYHYLRVAYNIFMYGLIIAVFAFIVASIIHGRTDVAPH